MTDLVGDVRRRATAGVRSVIVLSAATIPLSFVTNMVLGRVSPTALGYYSAVNILIATYYTFCVFGGSLVFTRFTPALETPRRLPFLLTYALIILGIFVAMLVVVPTVAPDTVARMLDRVGGPSMILVAAILLVTIPWGLATYFLYGTLRPAWAAATEKTAVVGFFLASTIGIVAWKDLLTEDPARFLWFAALTVYSVAALVGVVLVARTEEARVSERIRWLLPAGFWSVVFYTHISTLVQYVHQTLTPSIVLLWLDVESLGHLHAAFRYNVILNVVPVTVAAVIAPAMSKLEASGFREEGFGQAAAAIRTTLLLLGPAVLTLILFAGDAMAVFGPDFRHHRDVLRVIAVGALAAPVVHSGAGIAAALGAFRSYLAASIVYVVAAVALTTSLVPLFGLSGAASALVLSSLVRQTAILLVLRRLGFPSVPRVRAAWSCALVAMALALWLDPPRHLAALMWLVFVAVFMWVGRVTMAEIKMSLRRLLGRA